MRPSEAATLDAAELVVWMGPGLTPWLTRAIGTLAGDARSLALLEVGGTKLLGYREGDEVEWLMPGGMRRLLIESVRSSDETAVRH